MNDFKTAVNNKVVGLGNTLSPNQKVEYEYLDTLLNNLEEVKKLKVTPYYFELLPINLIKSKLIGKTFKNSNKWKCTILDVWKKGYELLVKVKGDSARRETPWTMFFKTIIQDGKDFNVDPKVASKYFKLITPGNVDNYIQIIKDRKDSYDRLYNQTINDADSTINQELNKHPNEMKPARQITRQIINQTIKDIKKANKMIADAFNATLTKEEQNTLINWLAKNIYSMRLYVVKDGKWDKAISELYPDEIYGSPQRTIPTEESQDTINGYVSINDITGEVPYEILQKITHKKDTGDIIKSNGGNKYRINNYLFVLYLLNNYNKNGFKVGVQNLYKDITL